jgi:N utilization substance protein B
MSNRHLSRTIALQVLYQWDFHGCDSDKLKEWESYVCKEFAPKFDDDGFIDELVGGVLSHRAEIDEMIKKFAPNWPIDSITIVDRNVLRLGAYELMFSDNIPSKVALNEAIELAKGFGGEASGRFVNGVLGAVYKDMIARGKEKAIDKEPIKPKEEINKTQYGTEHTADGS